MEIRQTQKKKKYEEKFNHKKKKNMYEKEIKEKNIRMNKIKCNKNIILLFKNRGSSYSFGRKTAFCIFSFWSII